MKQLRYIIISYLISHILYLPLVAATQPVELLPFTFAGRIVDYAHVAYDAKSCVEVRVKAKDGTLLAKTKTATYGNTAYNYIIDVPVASQAISRHATAGSEVVFEFVDPDGSIYQGLVPVGKAVIGNPGESSMVDVILSHDLNHDGVADEYVETLEYMMWKHGIATYDAQADYDGDGANNYAEYVAGTNPFDATDKFSIREMAEQEGYEDYVALRVMVTEGRTYTVLTSGALDKDVSQWVKSEFAVNDPSASLQRRITTGVSETGYRTIYVKKEGAQKFWKLTVE